MKQQHVVVVVRWPTGGIRTYLKYVYSLLSSRGWRVTVIAPPSDEFHVLHEDLVQDGVQFVWKPRGGIVVSLVNSFLSVIGRQDVDLVHSQGVTSAVTVSAFARAWGVPHLVTLHDIFLDEQFVGWRGWARKGAVGIALGQVNRIQTVSNDAHANLLRFFPRLTVHRGKTVAIPNGIDSVQFRNAVARDLRKELGLGEEHAIVGFLGRFMGPKGFRFLVGAMEELLSGPPTSRQPVVVAVGEGGYIREERAEIERRGLGKSFRFLPFVADAAGTIKGMDVVVMPSVWEASGILAMEVMAAGVPLIGTSCIGLRETLADTVAVVVPPGDQSALARALVQVIDNLDQQAALASLFSGHAQQKFDVGKTVAMVEREMCALLQSRRIP